MMGVRDPSEREDMYACMGLRVKAGRWVSPQTGSQAWGISPSRVRTPAHRTSQSQQGKERTTTKGCQSSSRVRWHPQADSGEGGNGHTQKH